MLWIVVILLSIGCAILGALDPKNAKLIMAAIVTVVFFFIIVRNPFYGLLIYVTIYLMRPGELYPAIASLHIERVVGILVLIFSIMQHKYKTGSFRIPTDRNTLLVLLFWVLIIFSITFSEDKSNTYDKIINFLKLIILYLLILIELNSKKRLHIFFLLYLGLIAFNAFLSFRDYYGGGAQYRMGIYRALGRTSAIGDPNAMAATLACTLPLVVAYFKIYRNNIYRIASIGIIGLYLLMIVNTGSRSGVLALIAAIMVIIMFTRYRLITFFVVITFLVGSWFVLPGQYQRRYMTMVNDERDIDEVSSQRISIWKNGMRMFYANPVFGVGSGSFVASSSSGKYGPIIDLRAHSLYVQLLSTMGVVGTVVWFMFLIGMIRKLFRMRKSKVSSDEPPNDQLRVKYICEGILGCLAALLISGVFGHSLYRSTWYIMSALTSVMMFIYFASAHKEKIETDD